QVFVAALADPEQLRLAAGRELTGSQAEPRGEIAPALEALSLADGGDKGGCDDRADAWDCHRRRASSFSFTQRANSPSKAAIRRSISAHCVRASATSTIIRELNPAPPCSSISTARNCSSFRLPCGATIPRSSRMARN